MFLELDKILKKNNLFQDSLYNTIHINLSI